MRAFATGLFVGVAVAVAIAVTVIAPPAGADEPPPPLVAALSCTPVGEAGQRVRCEVETRATGTTIRWADVEIASVPDHVAAL